MRENIPAALRAERRWLVWREESRNGKPTKVPYQAASPHAFAKSTDPTTWTTFEEASASADAHRFDGVGFVLGDGFAGVDLDDCYEEDTPLPEWAAAIVRRLGSYTEVSPSGKGLKIFLKGSVPQAYKKHPLEIYSERRYFTVTGNVMVDRGIEERPTELLALYHEVAREREAQEPAVEQPLPVPTPPIRIGDRLRTLVERGWHEGCGFTSASEMDLAITGEMLRNGHTLAEVVWVFRSPLFGFNRNKFRRDDYIQRTVARARKSLPSTTGAGRRLSAYSIADLQAMELKLAPPIVDRLVYEKAITLIAGPPKLGKTFFVMQMLGCVASGRPFLDEFAVTEAARGMHMTAELPLPFYRERWNRFFRPLYGSVESAIVVCSEKAVSIEADFAEVCRVIEAHSPKVVVLDPWIRYHDADENDSAEMKKALTQLDLLIERFGVAVVIVHHVRKKSGEGFEEEMEYIRGSSVLRSHPNVNIVLTKVKQGFTESNQTSIRMQIETNFAEEEATRMLHRGLGGLFEREIVARPDSEDLMVQVLQAHRDHAMSVDELMVLLHKQHPSLTKQAVRSRLDGILPAGVRLERRADGKQYALYEEARTHGSEPGETDRAGADATDGSRPEGPGGQG